MAPVIDEFWASPTAERHMLEKHGVSSADAIEAAESTRRYRRAHDDPSGRRRYLAAGRTEGGTRLWVVFEDEGDRRGRIITARPVRGEAEVVRHRRMRGD